MTDFKDTLLKLNRNLQTLREREAKYTGNAPLDLLNQIEDHQQAQSQKIFHCASVKRAQLLSTNKHT